MLDVLEIISELDVAYIQKLTSDGIAVVENGTSGLKQIVHQVDHQWLGASKGAVGHLLVTADVMKRLDVELKGIEVRIPSKTVNDMKLPELRADLIVRIGGKDNIIEVKNFQANKVKSNLTTLLSTDVATSAQELAGDIVPGQLLNQLVRYVDNDFTGHKLWFLPDAVPDYKNLVGSARTAKVAEVKADIVDHIMDVITKNEDEIARRYFGLDFELEGDIARQDWRILKDELRESLQDDFIEIVELEKLL